MPTLHVRSVPEDLYKQLQETAQENNRSLSAQVITLLTRGLQDEDRRKQQAEKLSSLRRRRFTPPDRYKDSTSLLREDRSR